MSGDPLNRRRPLERCVEGWPALDIHRLVRELETGTGDKPGPVRVPGDFSVEIDGGEKLLVGWHPSLPLRVVHCPRCGDPKYRLHQVAGVWGCRACHGLSYLSRHRSNHGLARLAWLRRRIKASPDLCSPIEPRRGRRYLALILEIRHLESALIGYVQDDVIGVLERRLGTDPPPAEPD